MGRIPVGLTFSMFVAAVSLGVMTICWNLEWPVERGLSLLVHASSALCLGWAVAGYLLGRYRPGFAARIKGRDLLAVLRIGAMATGLLAVIVMLYAAVTEGLFRTLLSCYEATPKLNVWPSGLLDLGAVACAILVVRRQIRNHELITALFWALIFAGLWAAFQIPAFRVQSEAGVERAVATRWASLFMVSSAAVIAVFAIAGGIIHRQRRRQAWPDALSILTEPQLDWPGFSYSAGLMAVIVLMLGCVYVILPWTSVAAFLAGGAMLALAARRWNENLADAGLALITLGVVSLVMIGFPAPRWWTAEKYAEVFNRVLVGLAIMTGFWYWLAGVWRQQLDQGQPWTTAGRMIHTTQRVGYLVGATAVLVSLHLSLWPKRPLALDPDNTPDRWVRGLSANGLLVLALTFAARRTGRATQAWLVLLTVASTVVFSLVRSSHSVFGEGWRLYWPIVMAVVAGLMLPLAGLSSRSANWRPFWEPTYLTGVFVAPLAAIAGVSLTEQLTMPQWVPAATFGCLTGVYLLAAVLPGPRTFVAVAVMCAVMGVWSLRLLGGSTTIAPAYFYTMLCGLSVALLASVYQHRKQEAAGAVRLLKWAGGSLAVISMIAGWIASCS